MPIPPYMCLKDDGGADTKGAVDVQEREGSIETRLSPSPLPLNTSAGAMPQTPHGDNILSPAAR